MREFWNNKVFDILGKIFDFIVLSILWLICSVPLITIIPSSAALYHSMARAVRRDRGYTIIEFFVSFRRNLLSGIVLSIGYIIAVVILYTCVDVANAVGSGTLYARFYYAGTFALSVVLIFFTMFFIPVYSRFQMKFSHMFRLSLYLSSMNALRLIPWIIALIGFCAVCYVIPIALIILPGMYTYFYTDMVEKVLIDQMEEMGMLTEEAKTKWYYDQDDTENLVEEQND